VVAQLIEHPLSVQRAFFGEMMEIGFGVHTPMGVLRLFRKRSRRMAPEESQNCRAARERFLGTEFGSGKSGCGVGKGSGCGDWLTFRDGNRQGGGKGIACAGGVDGFDLQPWEPKFFEFGLGETIRARKPLR
jgi:hypothetical protein